MPAGASRKAPPRLLGCLALALGAGLAWWALWSGQSPGQRPTYEQAGVSPGVLPEPRDVPRGPGAGGRGPGGLPAPSGPGAEAPTSGAANQGLVVRVERDVGGAPVPGAQVLLFQDSEAASALGLIPQRDIVGTGTTDTRGSCTLVPRRADGPLAVRVVATGYVPAFALVGPPGGEVCVRLRTGAEIAGRVQDRSGNPVGDILILAAESRVAKSAVEGASIGIHEAPVSATRADGAGQFKFSGLGDGWHELWVSADGWRVHVGPAQLFGREGAQVEAGSTGCVLVVEPTRAFRFRLVREGSRDPVYAALDSFSVGGAGVTAGREWRAGMIVTSTGPMRLGPQVDPSVFVGAVEFAEAARIPDAVKVSMQARGFRPCIADVRIWKPSEVLKGIELDEITLIPEPRTDYGTVIVECPREASGLARRRPIQLGITSPATMVFNGREVAADRWEFCGVPAGRHPDSSLWDGVSMSHPLDLDVNPGAITAVRMEWPAPMGVILDLQDEEDLRQFGAEVVEFKRLDPGPARPHAPKANPNNVELSWDEFGAGPEATLPEFEPETGRLLASLVEIPEPGHYEVAVRKLGFGHGVARFELKEGMISRVRVRLVRGGR